MELLGAARSCSPGPNVYQGVSNPNQILGARRQTPQLPEAGGQRGPEGARGGQGAESGSGNNPQQARIGLLCWDLVHDKMFTGPIVTYGQSCSLGPLLPTVKAVHWAHHCLQSDLLYGSIVTHSQICSLSPSLPTVRAVHWAHHCLQSELFTGPNVTYSQSCSLGPLLPTVRAVHWVHCYLQSELFTWSIVTYSQSCSLGLLLPTVRAVHLAHCYLRSELFTGQIVTYGHWSHCYLQLELFSEQIVTYSHRYSLRPNVTHSPSCSLTPLLPTVRVPILKGRRPYFNSHLTFSIVLWYKSHGDKPQCFFPLEN